MTRSRYGPGFTQPKQGRGFSSRGCIQRFPVRLEVKIVAHDITRELLTRFPDKYRPLPIETSHTDAELEVGGVTLELS